MKYKGTITAVKFADKYGLSRDLVYVHRHNGNKYVAKTKYGIVVYEHKLQLRHKFRRRVLDETIDLINELSMTPRDMSKLLAKYYGGNPITWSNFLYYRIYVLTTSEESILVYKVPKRLWQAYRYLRWLKRRENANKPV